MRGIILKKSLFVFVLSFLVFFIKQTQLIAKNSEQSIQYNLLINEAIDIENPFNISIITLNSDTEIISGFINYLKKYNYPVVVKIKNAKGEIENIDEFINEIKNSEIKSKPDLILTIGTASILKTAGTYQNFNTLKHIAKIPIIFSKVISPYIFNIVEPNNTKDIFLKKRQVTGVSYNPEISKIITSILNYSDFKRGAILYNKQNPFSKKHVEKIEQTARKNNLIIEKFTITDLSEILQRIREISNRDIDFVYLGVDYLANKHSELIAETLLKYKIPTISLKNQIEKNSNILFSVYLDDFYSGELAAKHAMNLLFLKKQSDINKKQDMPVFFHTSKYSLVLNKPFFNSVKKPLLALPKAFITINKRIMRKLNLYPKLKLTENAKFID